MKENKANKANKENKVNKAKKVNKVKILKIAKALMKENNSHLKFLWIKIMSIRSKNVTNVLFSSGFMVFQKMRFSYQ